MTVYVAAQILSSSVEYLFSRLYNSSMVTGGSKDGEWMARSFSRSSEGLHPCYKPLPAGRLARNLLMKSRMDSSSCFRIGCKELMFLFCHTEQRYLEMNAAQSLLNEFIELRGSLWNQASVGPHRLAGNTLHNRQSLPAFNVIPNCNGACDHKGQPSHRTW